MFERILMNVPLKMCAVVRMPFAQMFGEAIDAHIKIVHLII